MNRNDPQIISVKNNDVNNSIYYPLWLEVIEKIGDANKRLHMEELSKQLCAQSTISMLLSEFGKIGLVHRERFNGVWMFTLTKRGRIMYEAIKQMRTTVKYIAPSNCIGARYG